MHTATAPVFLPIPCERAAPGVFPAWQWDIFCTVIDNYGDAGVCWRLAAGLAERGQRVRLWMDDPQCLRWMAPAGAGGVELRLWASPLTDETLPAAAGDVLIEAFGCTLEDRIQTWWAASHAPGSGLWLNLEYLSAESYVARCHGLPSPVMHGPAAGHTKRFFYPGFTADTGGLLRERSLVQRQQQFDRLRVLQQLPGEPAEAAQMHDEALVVSLFCYEPGALTDLLDALAARPSMLLVFQGRGHQELLRLLHAESLPRQHGQCHLHLLPWLDQHGFDEVLWASHFNCVRGEDSLVRALWAGQPFVWHIYPQDDDAHHAKLEAFLDWLQAPEDLRQFHRIWNEMIAGTLPDLTPERLRHWQSCVQAARERLLRQSDQVSQLLDMAAPACGAALSG